MNDCRRAGGKLFGSLLALSAYLASVNAVAAQKPEEAHHARVALISEQTSILPGKTKWVGLHFQLDKDWHIYWTNPGDSGTSPQVKWDLPSGFSAGPLRGPAPVRLGKPPIVDYGYENEVLLMSPIQAPVGSKQRGDFVELSATVKWVVCRDVCIPDKAQLKLSVAISKNGFELASPWHELFQKTRERLPRQAPSNWTMRAIARKDRFDLTIEMGTSLAKAEFFPLEAQQIENAAPQTVTGLPKGVRLTLKKSDQLLKPIRVLRGVLVLDSGRSYQIAAPVSPGK